MPHTFTRHALYEMAWSQPIQSLAESLSLSDRGLAKICAAANIPVSARGYWAKKQAGKSVPPIPLPPRALGQSGVVQRSLQRRFRGCRNSQRSDSGAACLRARYDYY